MCVTSMGERRASPRQRRLNGAKIVFNNNSSVIDCIVRDLSSQGARLLVASPVGIPDRFDLRIDRNAACHPSKVTWRANDQIGVSFSTFLGDQAVLCSRNTPRKPSECLPSAWLRADARNADISGLSHAGVDGFRSKNDLKNY
jgi:hypothetical protein